MTRLTLVTGGVRCGKSRWAERLAGKCDHVTYIATTHLSSQTATEASPDPEMVLRVERHRRRRVSQFPDWETIEEPWHLTKVLPNIDHDGAILLECLNLWMTNLLVGTMEQSGLSDADVTNAVEEFLAACTSHPAKVIVVTNEVGWGIIPVNELARRFTDLLGEANQRFAQEATEVYACLAGIPVRLKPQPLSGMTES
ncbi:MAG: bifunctional adenosylcobinamide kinase/adenosylcobinamide-phosphate guanylyltransferase [Gemmataceae bacterium]